MFCLPSFSIDQCVQTLSTEFSDLNVFHRVFFLMIGFFLIRCNFLHYHKRSVPEVRILYNLNQMSNNLVSGKL